MSGTNGQDGRPFKLSLPENPEGSEHVLKHYI